MPLEQRLQHRVRQRGVGEQKREHGRHVGLDHAGAFGDAGDGDLGLADARAGQAPLANVSVVRIASAASRQPEP